MPISSLPSPCYIGDFGCEAYQFANMLKEAGFKVWQVLPLNPVGFGNSPYQCYSSKALDESFISIELLNEAGLLDKSFKKFKSGRVNYDKARQIKRQALKDAFGNFKENDDYREFIRDQWVMNYAIFISFKESNGNRCWLEWPEEQKEYPQTRNKKLLKKFEKDIKFHMFVQYQLYDQFRKLKKYVNELGIKVFGDLPFYVGIDSDDVYYNREAFCLLGDGRPQWISGVPPDYFSKTGQRWGNPLYNWDYLREHDYDLWFDRLEYSAQIYDILRIDHFRAFDTYWKIDAREETAMFGEWVENSGRDFFSKLFKKHPDIEIVAEDLGDIRAEVYELRDEFNLMGMKVIEFDFFEASKEHEVCYIGTHDNETLANWFEKQKPRMKNKIKKFIFSKYPGYRLNDGILQYALDTECRLVVLSAADLSNEALRINLPGTIGSPNWEFKLVDFKVMGKQFRRLKKMIERAGRS